MRARAPVYLVANARMPSPRAQSLQVAQMAAAFQRAGAPTTLVHARRHGTRELTASELFRTVAIRDEPPPLVEAAGCIDWIDRVPRRLQYVPARVQELTFALQAARTSSARRASPVRAARRSSIT